VNIQGHRSWSQCDWTVVITIWLEFLAHYIPTVQHTSHSLDPAFLYILLLFSLNKLLKGLQLHGMKAIIRSVMKCLTKVMKVASYNCRNHAWGMEAECLQETKQVLQPCALRWPYMYESGSRVRLGGAWLGSQARIYIYNRPKSDLWLHTRTSLIPWTLSPARLTSHTRTCMDTFRYGGRMLTGDKQEQPQSFLVIFKYS
jgi:hypothetical protein